MIAFTCGACGQRVRIGENHSRSRVHCPHCGQAVQVPAPNDAHTDFGIGANAKVAGDTSSQLLKADFSASEFDERPHFTTMDGPPGLANIDAPTAEEPLPKQIDGYRVVRELGAGAMGRVLQAEDNLLGRMVAIKIIRPELVVYSELRQRFLREAKAAATMEHINIIRILHVGEMDCIPYLVMPFLQGESLDTRLDRLGKLSVMEGINIARQVAEGLGAAHAAGLIHRDLKPGNLWVENHGRVKILDFGLAKLNDDTRLTRDGTILGTPAYMSPEQASGKPVDYRADLFSLGAVMHQIFSGQLPFSGHDMMSRLLALATETPRPLRQLDATLPMEIENLVTNLLAKEPGQRPASAMDVARQLAEMERGYKHTEKQSPCVPGDVADMDIPLDSPAVTQQPPFTDEQPPDAEPFSTPSRPMVQTRRFWVGIVLSCAILTTVTAVLWSRIHPPNVQDSAPIATNESHSAKPKSTEMVPADVPKHLNSMPSKNQQSVEKSQNEQEWLRRVVALPPAEQLNEVVKRLVELNPGYDGNHHPEFNDGNVFLLQLESERIHDLSPVRALPNLRRLRCGSEFTRKGILRNLTPLRGLRLLEIDCHGTQVADLSPLRGMPLQIVNCGHTYVDDISPLQGMHLTELYIVDTQVSNLAPVQGMRLQRFDCSLTKVEDLAPLRGQPLELVKCMACPIQDISPLTSKNIKVFWSTKSPIKNLTPLMGMPLHELWCDFQRPRDTELVDYLKKLKSLRRVNNRPAKEFLKNW